MAMEALGRKEFCVVASHVHFVSQVSNFPVDGGWSPRDDRSAWSVPGLVIEDTQPSIGQRSRQTELVHALLQVCISALRITTAHQYNLV